MTLEANARMTVPATGGELLDQVVAAGLLAEAAVRPYRSAGATDPTALARRMVKDRVVTPFQARVLLSGRRHPFFLTERYKLLEHLGSGGMGQVYLAEHLLLHRVVAIKLIIGPGPGGSSGKGAVDRFFREARAVAALDHPNVVRVFDMDRTPAGPFLVMEYVDGTNLQALTGRHGPLPAARVVDAARQAALGLQHAHDNGLVHRDVKPGNLLLDRHGTVKVVDLGLARHRDLALNQGLTARSGGEAKFIGTAEFIPPEQALDSGAADVRSDVYGLGASLYYLLTGKFPFGEGTAWQQLLAHQLRTPAPVADLRPDLPAELSDLVGRMMAKRPADRPQTMAEVVAALDPLRAGPLPPPPAAEMPRHPPAAYRLGLAPPPTAEVLAVRPTPTETRLPALGAGPEGSSIRLPGGSVPATTPPRSMAATDSGPAARPPDPSGVMPAAASAAGGPVSLAPAVGPPGVSRRALLIGGGLAAVAAGSGAAVWTLLRPADALPGGGGAARVPPPPVVPPPPPPAAPPPPAPITGVTVRGGGSTFIRPAVDFWVKLYQKETGVVIDYKGTGSGLGVQNLLERVTDFACTDEPIANRDLDRVKDRGGVVHVPLALGAVAVAYNLPDVAEPVRFPADVLADIYLGKITRWDDQAITSNNLGVPLPKQDIVVVRRVDPSGSGTNAIWTEFLHAVSGVWQQKVGPPSKVVRWPEIKTARDVEKSDGVVSAIKQTVGAIGYVELLYAKQRNLKAGAVQNAAGQFVEPTLSSVTQAANAALPDIPADLRFTLTNRPGEGSYPIAGCTWAALYTNQQGQGPVGRELVRFLRWAITAGQQHLATQGYSQLPPDLAQRALKVLDAVAVAGG